VTWLHGDHLGSASLATNASGQVVSNVRYKPFGEVRWQSGMMPTNRKFGGKIEESALGGIYDFSARYYDPLIGRFLSADSIVQAPGDPQTLNRYSYARSNPLRYTDPTGHSVCGAVAGVTIGGLGGTVLSGLASIFCPRPERQKPLITPPADKPERRKGDITKPDSLPLLIEKPMDSPFPKQKGGDITPAPSLPRIFSAEESDLEERAKEINRTAPHFLARRLRTIAVIRARANDGSTTDIVASSEPALTKEQRAMLQSNEIEARGPGHAEDKALRLAQSLGLQPLEVAASRPICRDCAIKIHDAGAIPVSPLEDPNQWSLWYD
jgi:RHS repeat-associated protein